MRSRVIVGISIAIALASVILLPWLAWQEARRQAFDAAADMTRAYARAVLARTDETTGQADVAIRRLVSLAAAPCSRAAGGG
jgi:sensor c-di-GMP phosphodiesterase-like protein